MTKTKLWMMLAMVLALMLLGGVHQIIAMSNPSSGPIVVTDVFEEAPEMIWAKSQSFMDLKSTGSATATVMAETFEGLWPSAGWIVTDTSTADGGEYLWGKRNCHPHTGTYGGWAVGGGAAGSSLGCTDGYTNNLSTWAVYGPFDLQTATQASLLFHVWGESEQADDCSSDYLFAGSSVDGDYFFGDRLCSDWKDGISGNGYYTRALDLSSRCGQGEVWIGFNFVSDATITSTGFAIDDLTLTVERDSFTYLYFPLVMRRWPPIPDVPVLNSISYSAGDDYYTVDWDSAYLADTYTLQEDDNASFSSPEVRYTGYSTSWYASDKAVGTYYYRVKATNSWGDSGWSSIRSVAVIPPQTNLYVGNDTGGNLCYEVYGTGIGRKCFSGSGNHYYGTFAAGTYTFKAEARCGSMKQSNTFPSGFYIHYFWCSSGSSTQVSSCLMGVPE